MVCPRCFRRFETDHLFCSHDGERLGTALEVARTIARPSKIAGTLFGERYRVLGFVGKGAMARVYLAEDERTHQPVAVKVLEIQHNKSPRTRARFIQEAQAAATIWHRHIVDVLDVALQPDGTPYLVLELLFGESLGQLLRREKILARELALQVFRATAEGLAAAHAVSIIHRDVKPDNVFLVGPQGEPHGLKVLDFGFAKLLASPTGITVGGVAVGTVDYMAPEQTVSDLPDARTDVYGLGILMFRALAGHVPFESSENADTLAAQLLRAPTREIPDPDLDRIVRKALKKRPEHRYASMRALIEDIDRALAFEPVLAQPDADEPDIYVPQTKFAQNAAQFLYKRLGKVPPAW
jgi:serine/threonine-protein kinase